MSDLRDENGNIKKTALIEVLSTIIHEDYKKYVDTVKTTSKTPIDEMKLYTRPAMFSSLFGFEEIDYPMDIDNPLFKFPEGQKEEVHKALTEKYKITDYQSLIESVGKRTINKFLGISLAYVTGDEEVRKMLNLEAMDAANKEKFSLMFYFVELVKDIFPSAGAYAWDINNAVGLTRAAFGVDLIDSTSLMRTYLFWVDQAKERFESWAEYAISLEIGAAFFCLNRFMDDGVTYAITFAKEASAIITEEYAKLEWLSVVE